MKKFKLIINAPFINSGGGKVLLLQLLESINDCNNLLIILDDRLNFNLSINKNHKIIKTKKNIFNFLYNELYIFLHSSRLTKVICLHNLPVFFKNPGFVSVYVHNRLYFLKNQKKFFFSRIKRFFFSKSFKFCDEVVVQTPTMKDEMQSFLKKECLDIPVTQFPFFNTNNLNKKKLPKKYDYIYVADGSAHKNHSNLLKAWIILAHENIRPSMVLTVPLSQVTLINKINATSKIHNLKIYNFSDLDHSEISRLYNLSRFLIYPSFLESFGLPLLEASFYKLKIVASELDYVRDICNPDFTFDPTSPTSIASSVKRSLNIKPSFVKVYKSKQFVNYILSK